MRREKTQISKIRNEKREVRKNTKEIQGIIRDYFENLYSNKLENLEEMDKFLDSYDYPNMNQEDISHLNRFITHNNSKCVKDLNIRPETLQLVHKRAGNTLEAKA
jgi:hypothetical protein